MKTAYIGAFAAVIIVLVFPEPASAECWWTACESYGYYDQWSNEIVGYSLTVDYSGYMYVSTDGTLWGPSGPAKNSWSGWMWGEAYANYSYTPGQPGVYSIAATHYWSTEPDYWYYTDGTTGYDITVPQVIPQSEDTQVGSPAGYGAIFIVTLQPNWWNFGGGTVEEQLYGAGEDCSSYYPDGPVMPPLTAAPPFNISGNQYQDTINISAAWIYPYNVKVYNHYIPPCGWSAGQTMTYNGSPYISRFVGMTLTGLTVDTYRDAVQSLPWP